MTQRRAIIIGAGIGGLTSAVALAGQGWDVEVIERTPKLKPVGYALVMAPNAQRALDAIPGGIVEQIHGLAAIQGDGGIRNARGSWLSRNNADIALKRYGHPAVAMRRSELVDILSAHLPAKALRLGTVVTGVNADTGEVALDSGEVLRGDLIVAADGIHSGTRTALFPGHPQPVFAGLTAWQAVIRADGVETHVGTTWSGGGEFGMLPLANGWLYVFAEAAVDEPMVPRTGGDTGSGTGTDTVTGTDTGTGTGTGTDTGAGTGGSGRAELERRFGHLHQPIPAVIARIGSSPVLRTDIYSMRVPLPAFHRGKVAIVGDAAHPMAPNLGQGACQAIEDAVTLAYCVRAVGAPPGKPGDQGDAGKPRARGDGGGVAAGLAEYTAARLPRTSLIVRRSEQIAKLATARNPVSRAFRNGMLRMVGLMGPSVALRQADFVMSWEHPATSAGRQAL